MRKLVGVILVVALLAGCSQASYEPPVQNEPEPEAFNVTRFEPSDREAMCWVPCWDYLHVTVAVDEGLEPDRDDWRLDISALRDSTIVLPPQLGGTCEGNQCELSFFLMGWRTKAQIFPATMIWRSGGEELTVRLYDWVF